MILNRSILILTTKTTSGLGEWIKSTDHLRVPICRVEAWERWHGRKWIYRQIHQKWAIWQRWSLGPTIGRMNKRAARRVHPHPYPGSVSARVGSHCSCNLFSQHSLWHTSLPMGFLSWCAWASGSYGSLILRLGMDLCAGPWYAILAPSGLALLQTGWIINFRSNTHANI